MFFKKYPTIDIKLNKKGISNREYLEVYNNVITNFECNYGEFISAVLRDIPAVILPMQRIGQNPYLNQLFSLADLNSNKGNLINLAKGNSLASYFFSADYLLRNNLLGEKSKCFLNEVGNYKDILTGLRIIIFLRNGEIKLKEDIKEIRDYFELENNVYQFLDKPHSNLFFDIIINQLAYPMHNNVSRNERFKYKAKKKQMFTDVTLYDECRYIYEWLPGPHQVISAFENKSWQYVFRFALDGLVKMRQNYNNEFFFQGAVISNAVEGFSCKKMRDRIVVK